MEIKTVFPDLGLRSDSKAVGRWSTSKNGEYFAIGVGGAVTGSADLLIIDDPHSSKKARVQIPVFLIGCMSGILPGLDSVCSRAEPSLYNSDGTNAT